MKWILIVATLILHRPCPATTASPAQSILDLQAQLKASPDQPKLWWQLGLSYAKDAQYGKAADAYRLALSHGWKDPMCHCALSLALREIKQPKASLSSAKRCLELLPGYAGAWNLIGNAEIDLSDRELALKAYQHAVLLQPSYAAAHFNLGITLEDLGHLNEAEAALRKSLSLNSKQPDAWLALGNVQFKLKQARPAIKSFQEALRLGPDLADAEWGLAKAWRSLGNLGQGRLHEERYKKLVREADKNPYPRRRDGALQAEAWDRNSIEP